VDAGKGVDYVRLRRATISLALSRAWSLFVPRYVCQCHVGDRVDYSSVACDLYSDGGERLNAQRQHCKGRQGKVDGT
jgi:hypothetical protein